MKKRACRNRTITVDESEKAHLLAQTMSLTSLMSYGSLRNRIIHQDFFACHTFLPDDFVDLMIVDPPYNLNKRFGVSAFKKRVAADYVEFIDSWLKLTRRMLKNTASIYICSDWSSSGEIQQVISGYFIIRNRITWEREKGRGARGNWKSCSEDIWYCTVSDDYFFDSEAVKLKKKIMAPYRDEQGKPKDWLDAEEGKYRLTAASNIWTDISVPFWSMPENTDHPTQKPEKLMAKIILASSRSGDFIFDPFAGSGSACVTAAKLGRLFLGIEKEEEYCLLAMKRLAMAEQNKAIQGYSEGCFRERNSLRPR